MAGLQIHDDMVRRYPSPRAEAARHAAPSGEEVLTRYLKRIDPDIAASFTDEQREALEAQKQRERELGLRDSDQ